MSKRTITCGHCKREVAVTKLNRVKTHKVGPGGQDCVLSGARPEAAVQGLRVLPKQ